MTNLPSSAERTGAPDKPPFYIRKPEVNNPDWEGLWDSVQRRRKEEDPLMKGGNYKERRVWLIS